MSQKASQPRSQSEERKSKESREGKRITSTTIKEYGILVALLSSVTAVGVTLYFLGYLELFRISMIVVAIIGVLFLIRKVTQRFTKYTIVMLILFMIIVIPIFLGIVGVGGYGTKFSIYNEGWDGLSLMRTALEGEGYTNITNGMSSLAVLNRIKEPGVLAIIGPAGAYTEIDTISLITFLARGGSLIVADDYGSGAQIFEPFFNLLNTWDEIAELSEGAIPSLTDLFNFGGNQTNGNQTSGGLTEQGLIFEMIGMFRGLAFNGSVLSDSESYTSNPAQPLLTYMETSNPLTNGINTGLQMEFGTAISIAIRHTETVDIGGVPTEVNRTDWMPLQAISLELFGQQIENMFLPFLPFYTSKSSWLESDFLAAKNGEATPDIDEWGNVMFAPIMTLPIGLGKIVMIGDPDVFINKWIEKTSENDNLQFSLNLFDYVTSDLNTTSDPRSLQIIFDEGHAHQKFYSASIFSIILMKLFTEMSMFPLYSPFVVILMAVIAYPLIPKKTRLTPVLWTKYRAERGRSRFEREIRRIVDTGAYSEAIGLLYRTLLRGLRKVSKQPMATPEEIADFFTTRDPALKAKDLLTELKHIDIYLAKPRLLPEHVFMRYMTFIKGLIDRLPRM